MIKINIEGLYKENYKKLKNFFIKRSLKNEAEDLVQQTFLKISENVHNLKNIHKAPSYIFKIAQNLVVDTLRNKNKSYLPNKDLEKTKNYEKDVEQKIQDEIEFEKLISQLNKDEKIIIRMKIVDNLTFKEISEILNININTVISKFNRAVKKLAKKL
ncbi:MAG: sigma-70 family RNA polymerase sigma factor [Candidatus Calescibacterium sp.]|nr:sigma-70 family RNA polymerase sigma factor [Candidatus Calescibacterium sp.]MDW8132405.1 sigma-70 family RNA polymerase sigma factor [Candidatus Calescibacterium sp.]